MILLPRLALLSLHDHSAIYQNLSAIAVVDQILLSPFSNNKSNII
jgi:uncharacterized protein involved in type VI secretion and phage assembly